MEDRCLGAETSRWLLAARGAELGLDERAASVVSRHAAAAAAAAAAALLLPLSGTSQCSQHLLGRLHHGIAVHLQGTSIMLSAVSGGAQTYDSVPTSGSRQALILL
jgi:hypothetical protein